MYLDGSLLITCYALHMHRAPRTSHHAHLAPRATHHARTSHAPRASHHVPYHTDRSSHVTLCPRGALALITAPLTPSPPRCLWQIEVRSGTFLRGSATRALVSARCRTGRQPGRRVPYPSSFAYHLLPAALHNCTAVQPTLERRAAGPLVRRSRCGARRDAGALVERQAGLALRLRHSQYVRRRGRLG